MMQELGKFDLKINIIPKVIEKYMSFSISVKFTIKHRFYFFSASLDDLVHNLGKMTFIF